MKRLTLFLGAFAAFFAHAAQAGDSGAYLGAGINTDGTLVACTNATANCNNNTTYSTKGNAAFVGGYNFNKFVGVEVYGARVGTYNVADTLGNFVGTVKASEFTLAAKGGYKFKFGLSVFGKLGIGEVWNHYTPGPGWTLAMNNNQKSTGLAFGLGLQYDFDDTIGIRLVREAVSFRDGGYDGAVAGTNLLLVFNF